MKYHSETITMSAEISSKFKLYKMRSKYARSNNRLRGILKVSSLLIINNYTLETRKIKHLNNK